MSECLAQLMEGHPAWHALTDSLEPDEEQDDHSAKVLTSTRDMTAQTALAAVLLVAPAGAALHTYPTADPARC